MVGELMMLPVRVGVRATRLWLRAVEETVSVTGTAAGRLIELVASRGSGGTADEAMRPSEPEDASPSPIEGEPDRSPAPAQERTAEPREPIRELRSAGAPATAPAAEPVHVSEEPTLVEEFAEPGAEEGAGAEVHVGPPWDDYARLNAKEIVARLSGADAAELAAVELYEATTRHRQTILNAVERELRRVNGSGSRRNQR